jgi:hypothetical protein
MSKSNHRLVRRLVALATLGALAEGCLDRPVAPTEPKTTNVFVKLVPQNFVDKIDLLFMIDNSLSMKDKQLILEDAVPVLVERLVTPRCLDGQGNAIGKADANGRCAAGDPEFIPIKDIHIGVITSSLGNHGGEHCTPMADDAAMGRTPDDRAELLPFVRPGLSLTSWNDSGFLAWDPGQDKNLPPGEANLGMLIGDIRAQVAASGEIGCGYESSLEAWYRFLVDPEPPVSMSVVDNANVKGPVNGALLEQRADFLRPDSLLAIVMLTDENDCSINDDDGQQGFYVSSSGVRMPRASSACATNPNDPCCHTCAMDAPAGCPSNDADPECSKKTPEERYAALTPDEDKSGVRCFEHKRRFGLDLLYPTERYIDALTKRTVRNRAGMDVANPIFAPAPDGTTRPGSQVLLAGILGVPWQDIATEQSLQGRGLEYLDAAELSAAGRWDLILGDRSKNLAPSDPHMHESIAPRTGANPLLGIPIAPATSTNSEENPINGHEQNVPGFDDLQYACTFRLPMARDCAVENSDACDCNANEQVNNRPLCDFPNGPNTDGLQRYAKAYPGLRHLEVLKGVGNNGIVASICPKNTAPEAGLEPATDPSYGYNPAVASILEIFRERLGGQCLPRKLAPDADRASATFGQVPCSVVEAVPDVDGACGCDATQGRKDIESVDLRQAVRVELEANRLCGGDTSVNCNSFCLCEVKQLEGADLTACQAGSKDPNRYGYCYVDADQGIGDPALVSQCPATQKRLLRWTGEGLPANGSSMMMACLGAPL